MKRCPECQFLYENESTQCDMDGTPLRYTVKLPTLPGLAQSIWDKWTIALLIGVVTLTVLAILYRATPRAYTSSAGHSKPVRNETPAINQSPPVADSVALPESSAAQSPTDSSETLTDSGDPFAAPSNAIGTKAPKSKRGLPDAGEKESAPAPVIHVQPVAPAGNSSSNIVAPATSTTSGGTSSSGTSAQKPASSATSTSIHPPPPPATNKATPAQKKESGFKSVLKKAGNVLKRPFGEN